MNYLSALVGEVASSKAVKGQGDVPEVKVHHPPRSDCKGWTTVQSGRKHKGGKIVSQAGAKPAGKKPAGEKPAGKKPAGESGWKNKGGQNADQAGAKPAGKTSVPVTLGAFFDRAKHCSWKPAVAAVVAETSRPALVASWPTPQEACDAKIKAETATAEVKVEVEVKTTATAANKKRRNKKKRNKKKRRNKKILMLNTWPKN